MIKNVLFTFCLVMMASSLWAQKTYYVSPSGNNSNTGLSRNAAFKTINHAASRVEAGDVVKILPGTYTRQNMDSPWSEVFIAKKGTSNKYITFQGESDAQGNRPKIVSASVKGIDLLGAAYIIIENLEFEPNNQDVKGMINNPSFGLELWRARRAFGIDNASHHIIIRNNYVHDFPGNGIAIGGSDVILIENNIVEHCAFMSRNGNSGISVYHAANLNVPFFPQYPNHGLIFKDNVCRYNVNLRGFAGGVGNNRMTDGNGIIIDDLIQGQKSNGTPYNKRTLVLGNICYGNGGQGINVFSSNNVDVYNNTMFDNAQTTRIANPAYDVAIGNSQLSMGRVNGARVRNNILFNTNNSRTTISRYEDRNIVYSNNMHWNNQGNPQPLSGDDLIANPNFVNPRGLTQAQTNLLATMTNPFNTGSNSARLREPTVNNGFPKPDLRLKAGSPAINAGFNTGFGNPVGRIDIGALEYRNNGAVTDDIVSVNAPNSVQPGTTVTVAVTYASSTNRDIQVAFQSTSGPDYTVYGEKIVKVGKGRGTVNVRVPIRANTPIARDAYQFQTFITTTGGGWPRKLDNIAKTDIDVVRNSGGGGSYTLTIGAEGSCGGERIRLLLNNRNVKEWTLTTDIKMYSYNQYNGTDEVKVAFVNDQSNGCDYNVVIDWVQVCGTLYQTENRATRTGCGGPQELFCNGNFNFGALGCNNARVSGQLSEMNSPKLYPNPNEDGTLNISAQYEIETVHVYGLSGNLVRSFKPTQVMKVATIDIAGLKPGMYLVEVVSGTNRTAQKLAIR